MGISKPTNPLVEAIISRAAPGGLQKEILVVPDTVGTGGTEDYLAIQRETQLRGINLFISTAAATAGSYTLDVKVDGVSVLSGVYDLTSLAALTLKELTLASFPVLAVGSYVSFVTVSDNADLTGSGLIATLVT